MKRLPGEVVFKRVCVAMNDGTDSFHTIGFVNVSWQTEKKGNVVLPCHYVMLLLTTLVSIQNCVYAEIVYVSTKGLTAKIS